ncbi:hypothetical protein [Lacunimicrobium album]
MPTSNSHVNLVALVKDGQRYVFVFDEKSISQLMQTLGRYASDPELNFNWYDAALLSQKIRRLQQEAKPAPSVNKAVKKKAG